MPPNHAGSSRTDDDTRAVASAIAYGPKPTPQERELLGWSPARPERDVVAIERFNNMMRAAMLASRTQRRFYAQLVEHECRGDPALIAAAEAFMAQTTARMADARQEFLTLLSRLAQAPAEGEEQYPETQWRSSIHHTMLKALDEKRQDLAADLCVSSWNSGLLPPQDVERYHAENAATVVAYCKAEELVRNTSRAVCRMITIRNLRLDSMGMLALREEFENRLTNAHPQADTSTANMAKRIVSMVGMDRLDEAVNRPESENPKDAMVAAYCEEVYRNLPHTPRDTRFKN